MNLLPKRVLKKINSQFGEFSVEELTYNGRPSRVLFNGPQHSAQSGIALDNDPRMLFDYNQSLFELTQAMQPKNILVLGGGALTLPSKIVEHLRSSEIEVIEINPDLIKLATEHFDFIPNPRLKVIVDDAFKVITKFPPSSYDLIITDLFNDLSTPDIFLSLDFAKELNRIKKTEGIVATNCISALSGDESEPARKLLSVYKEAIGPVRIVKVERQYHMNHTPQNLLILAGPNSSSLLPGLEEVNLV